MKISNEQLKKYFHGACRFDENNGYLSFYRYTEEQISFYEDSEFFHTRAYFSTSIIIEFDTCAENFGFEYMFSHSVREDTCIEVYVNGEPFLIEPLEDKSETKLFSCALQAGLKRVTVYFPAAKQTSVRNFTVDKDIYATEKGQKVLWIGDSITQGYGSDYSSLSYVNIVNRKYDLELINHGIGGTGFKKIAVSPIAGFMPDKIVVSLGTNIHNPKTLAEDTEGFFERLNRLYPQTPILAITPVCRLDANDENVKTVAANIIKETCKKQNILVIDGYTLVPRIKQMFLEDNIHPNTLGHMWYAQNLIKLLNNLNFFV